mmetsp:Transcript_36967/g.101755  ORF Transcript_36967/g.101755 Transcript_36967/m.101755 type:complete len:267 (+) Transcript_36967:1339-2139(+)
MATPAECRKVPLAEVLALEFGHGHGAAAAPWRIHGRDLRQFVPLRQHGGRDEAAAGTRVASVWPRARAIAKARERRQLKPGELQKLADHGDVSGDVRWQCVARARTQDFHVAPLPMAEKVQPRPQRGLGGRRRDSHGDHVAVGGHARLGGASGHEVGQHAFGALLWDREELGDFPKAQVLAIVKMLGVGNLPEDSLERCVTVLVDAHSHGEGHGSLRGRTLATHPRGRRRVVDRHLTLERLPGCVSRSAEGQRCDQKGFRTNLHGL